MRKPIGIFAVLALSCSFAIAADHKPDPAEAARLNNIGVALMNQQRMEKAVEKFDLALEKDPKLSVAYLDKGIALLNLQKLPESEAALNKAGEAMPKNPRVWYNLGLLNRGAGKYDAAIENFNRVTTIDPNDSDTFYMIGSLYLQLQKYEDAIGAYKSALKINPLHASAEFGLAKALQRAGKVEEARDHLHIFEHLTKDKISSPMTLIYGEQGRYSLAEDVHTGAPEVGAMIPVTFEARPLQGGAQAVAATAADTAGLCMMDVNGDGKFGIVALGSGSSAIRVFLNDGSGKFKEASAAEHGLKAEGTAISCAVGDFDNDGHPDLAVAFTDQLLLFRNLGNGKFENVTKAAGISALNHPAGMSWVDYDHDGDLDLFVTGSAVSAGTNVLWRNNGNGTFTEVAAERGLQGIGSTKSVVLTDLNNDRAVDLLITGDTGATAYINPREGKFQTSALYEEKLPPATGAYVFDFNKDGWMDVVLTHDGTPGISLWKNLDGKHFERVALPISDAQAAWGVTAIDVDNDGWLDLAAVVQTAKGPAVRIFRNTGSAGFVDVSKAIGLDKLQLQNPRGVVAADVDSDGAADLIVSQGNAAPVVLHNHGGSANHSVRITLAGLADNKSALGTKVEVFADGLWQKWEIVGGSGYMSQGPNEILAGIGKNSAVDIVRMLWPGGVVQDETDIAMDKPVHFLEIDRRGSSCPTLFAWNGEKYEFVSDVIGAAVIGHWISPTEKNLADPDEWVKVEGSQLRARNGKLSLRFGEPMEEVNFVDQVRLVAVDHPANADVYPDERFLSAPPFASGKVFVTGRPHPPVGAWDDAGNDVLDLVRENDHQYVRDFRNLTYAGYAKQHALTLDLGEWSPNAPLRLFLQGFIEYFTANSMYAAWQAGINPVAPYIEAQMPDGSWKRVVDDMGFPAGLTRMITVDLTGKLPANTRKIRIVTNLQIYWDQVLVDNAAPAAKTRVTELPLLSSDLQFRGYPQQVDGETPGDLTYIYEKASKTGPFTRERGNYTHYGDVTELLKQVDDHYVIFGSGEDMDLEFDPAALPKLPAGWKRDYFFYANGFVKDMDFYEATPFTVADLPFHRMSAYPYPVGEHYPDDLDSVRYRLEWDDRFDSGTNGAGNHFGFDYENRRQ
ncbi:TPR repeat protein [Candidatus Koribacter versatilis Ellin345]|uniref:TPR repeat protein n=1 Tax=Koribacter versatilis (strain Ellin345) TaxID=204669 RepID=Q1IR17_KORVE|nr:FG-GAP-like repeat-containing protein [Candidatus Koribacter versatilis]ABF40683.1 TPR repeat protein [Candidatus Koribacter versatilis Ellin345]